MGDPEVEAIVDLSDRCDQGQALHKILDLLVAADFDEHIGDDHETDEEYENRVEAETTLFKLATAWAARRKS
jgi:hypothetical protein